MKDFFLGLKNIIFIAVRVFGFLEFWTEGLMGLSVILGFLAIM